MTVELEKDLVIGMLTVLGKLINRNATDPVRKALRIEAQFFCQGMCTPKTFSNRSAPVHREHFFR